MLRRPRAQRRLATMRRVNVEGLLFGFSVALFLASWLLWARSTMHRRSIAHFFFKASRSYLAHAEWEKRHMLGILELMDLGAMPNDPATRHRLETSIAEAEECIYTLGRIVRNKKAGAEELDDLENQVERWKKEERK